jgi:glycerol-3-phosphate acyltransferase PlsX
MEEKPSQALRHGRRRSSMWRAIEAVKKGEADFAVSAGNTGALMAMARFVLRTTAEIDRPAIAALWPTLRGESVVLDCGATIGADAHQLFDFAVMGGAMARALFDIPRPTVGLLNIGVEEVKGLEPVREAGLLLKEANLPNIEYYGFVEGDDIGKGTVDVVVTEGFTGNIALKTAEGTARQVGAYLQHAFKTDVLSQLGAVLAGQAIDALKRKLDPRNINGGVFLGLNGIVIKSHGGTDETGFKAAVSLACEMARHRLMEKIGEGMRRFPALDIAAATPQPENNPA